MNTLPWYKSPVYVGILINILVGLVNMLNLQEIVTVEFITQTVAIIMTAIGIIAAAVAEWKRRRSTMQPLTLTDQNKKV